MMIGLLTIFAMFTTRKTGNKPIIVKSLPCIVKGCICNSRGGVCGCIAMGSLRTSHSLAVKGPLNTIYPPPY